MRARPSRRVVVLVALLLAAAALGALTLGFFPQGPLRSLVESRLKASTGPNSRIGELRVVPGRLEVEIRGLVLDAPGYRLETDHVLVTLAAKTLFNPGFVVNWLEADGGHLTLKTPVESTPEGGSFAAPVVIRHIDLKGITLSTETPDVEGGLVLRSVAVRGSLGEGVLSLTAGGGAWQHGQPVLLGPFSARLRVSPHLDLQLEALDAGLERTRVQARGSLGNANALRPDVRFEASVDLSEVARLSGIPSTDGVMTARGRLWGVMGALALEAEVSSDGLRASGWKVERVRGEIKLDPGARDATASARLSLFGGDARLNARLSGEKVTGELSGQGLDLTRLLLHLDSTSAADVTGAASAQVRFDGDLGRRVAVDAVVKMAGVYRHGTAFHGEATARGPIVLPSPNLDLAWTMALDTEPGPASSRTLPSGRFTATGTARGSLPPKIEAELNGALQVAGQTETVTIVGSARAQGDHVNADVRLTGLGGTAEGSAETVGSRAVALEMTARGIDLARFAPGAGGQASLHLKASGPFDALSGTGGMRVDALSFHEVSLGDLRADVEATRGSARIRADLPRINAHVDADVVAEKDPVLRGTLTLNRAPLGVAAALMPEGRPLEGTVTGTAGFVVPFSSPASGSVEGRVDALEVTSETLSAKSTRPFTFGVANERLKVQGLRVDGHGLAGTIDGSGGMAASAPIDVRLTFDSDLASLPLPETWRMAGAASGEIHVDGTRATPSAHGFVSVADMTIESPTTPPLRLATGRIEMEGDVIRIPGLTAELASGSLSVEGRIPVQAFWAPARRSPSSLAKNEEARLAFEWSGVEAATLLQRLVPEQGTKVESVLAGRAELQGGLASIAEARGTITLPATLARVDDLALEVSPVHVRLDSGLIRAESVDVRAGGGSLRVSGSMDLLRPSVDASGQGTLDLRALSPFMAEAALTGTSTMDVQVRGALDAPDVIGTLRVNDGSLRLRALPQPITGVTAEVLLDGRKLRLQSLSAGFGGGTLSGKGSARIAGAGLADADFAFAGRDLAVRYPEGMRSRLEADLVLTGQTGAFRLAGAVRALRGIYDLDTALGESLKAPPPQGEDSPLLRSVALDLRVTTESPVLVRNNLAQLQATGRVSVRGDLQTPAPVGTLDIASGGKIYLQGREFVVESGHLVYSGDWDPALTLGATARIADLDRTTGNPRANVEVTVGLEGRLSAPRLSLRSDPSYSRLEIVNLIAAGDSQNPSTRLALSGSAATVLAGRLSHTLGDLGLDQVSIQPELVTREGEVETGARFTFGKRLSPHVNLVYSLSLQDPEGRFVQLEATPWRDVTLSSRRTDQGSFTNGVGQRFHLGGPRAHPESAEQKRHVKEVRVEGDFRTDQEAPLRSRLRTNEGDRKTVWDLQDDADRLRADLVEQGFLEAEVSARFEDQAAVFRVSRGHEYRVRVDGMDRPPDLARTIRASLFEEDALDLGRERLLRDLRGRGHLRAVVEARIEEGHPRTLAFAVKPGALVRADVTFSGSAALSSSRLLDAAGGPGRLLTDPVAAVRDILAAYHQAFYLDARVGAPRVRDGATVSIEVPVREGARARVAAVRFEGATLDEADLIRVAGISVGSEYDPDRAMASVDALRGRYFGLGYSSVRINARLDKLGENLALTFDVEEGERVTVRAVEIQGLRHARESLVRRQIQIEPGDPLDPRKLAELERRLLDLGLFTRAAAIVSNENPATVTVTLEEGDRIRAGYLLSYNDEKGRRVEADGEVRSLLGAGLSLGGRVSAGPDIQDARVALSIPGLLLPTGRITASLFRLREDLPLVVGGDAGPTFERVQTGAQIQGARPLGNLWNLLYGYRLKKVIVASEFLNSSHRVAGIDVSLLRDTRDSPVDARRGRFLSLSLEISPQALGSDFNFVKGFAQAFLTRPLTGSLTWAQGYRLGLAHAFGGEPLVSDEGFEAGGANSIRGFASGVVGREDYFFGRQGVIVLNQELRYHHPSGFGGVAFYDVGNTFATVSDFSLRLRHALGIGLRWESPVGLLRADFGVPLFPRPGESRYKLFLSFGQAF